MKFNLYLLYLIKPVCNINLFLLTNYSLKNSVKNAFINKNKNIVI